MVLAHGTSLPHGMYQNVILFLFSTNSLVLLHGLTFLFLHENLIDLMTFLFTLSQKIQCQFNHSKYLVCMIIRALNFIQK